jgi:hypothetical protein
VRLLHLIGISLLCLTAAIINPASASATPSVVISVPDQTLALIDDGVVVARFPVSTSKFGLGDRVGTYATPLGAMSIASRLEQTRPSARSSRIAE